jgi:hypothetical protein
MTAETTASAAGVVTALRSVSPDWPDRFCVGVVGLLDGIIRTCCGVHEFTDDPACVLRIGRIPARARVSLSDGTQIAAGEVVGTLHLWNEHLPRYAKGGPDLGWACKVRSRVLHSLHALAVHLENEPAWRPIRALHGEAALTARLGALQVQRVAERFGFERVPTDFSLRRRLHALGEGVTLWALTRAFNPAALSRQPFFRDHHQLWISRASLIERYAHRQRRSESEPTRCSSA